MTYLRLTLLCTAMLGAASACDETDLFVPQEERTPLLDDKLEVSGAFCAEAAADLQSFLKIMLIIDKSNSMNVSDPNNRRVSAAQEVVMRFVDDPQTFALRAGVQFAVIQFFGDVNVSTRDERGLPGFSSDGGEILFGLTQLAETGANTGYDKALARAFLMLDRDMARLPDVARERSRYEIVFVSDGMPYPENCLGQPNSPTAAVDGVERIKNLETLHGVPIRFSTAFASHPNMFGEGSTDADQCEDDNDPDTVSDAIERDNDTVGEETRALLRAMANAGGGTFEQFQNGDAISFEDFEFASSRRIYTISSFVASNLNARAHIDTTLADSDGDGLPDQDEILLGTSLYLRDSDFDGFNDALEWRLRSSGLDPLDPSDATCSDIDRNDTDGDGLLDCEEIFMGTLRRRFDSDADGLPDGVEVLAGTNPTSANPLQDIQSDSDGDGAQNTNEVRWHTDPAADDVAHRSRIAYAYHQSELPLQNGQACYEYSVSNITLASTRTESAENSPGGIKSPEGWNRVMFYFAQRPYDDPLGDPLYRVACVDARFLAERDLKSPPSGRMEIPFRRPSDTYEPSSALAPQSGVCDASVDTDCGPNALWCVHRDNGACDCFQPPQTGTAPPTYVGPCPACADGVDNDNDGLTDYPFDPDCFESTDNDEGPSAACLDGVDNDGDGLVDWPFDPGCTGYQDDDEGNTSLPACANGVDDDGDGVIDFPADPGCFAAADPSEGATLLTPEYACSDGLDNDGDGLIDAADPGCFGSNDIDEDGPATCFYCQRQADALPGQCDLKAGRCKARSGTPPGGACTTRLECRGSPCVNGACVPCLRDTDCDSAPGSADGLCDARRGWCLEEAYIAAPCTSNADCGGAPCDTAFGYCRPDPYYACRDDGDCRPDEVCSQDRRVCMRATFHTSQCADLSCDSGVCVEDLGWCLPANQEEQCHHDDHCPFGACQAGGYCDQQTFVLPSELDPERDCLRGR